MFGVFSLVDGGFEFVRDEFFVFYTHRTESTSVETVVAFKALLIRLSRTAQWHQPHWRHSTTA